MGYYQNNRGGSRNNSRNSNRSYGGGGGGRRKGPNKQYIHPSKFVKAAKPVEVTEYTPTHTFADFNLHELLQNNLDTLGYTYPSAIQDQALQPGLAGKDVVGVANTGTGKTAAFGIPMLHKLISERGHRALIMAPTRELAQQIERELKAIGKGCGVQGALLIGGTPMRPQLDDLRRHPDIIVGTPGRIKDHMERGTLKLEDVNLIALDEVDRMLDMGFVHDMREILKHASNERQSFFFSATIDRTVRQLINDFSKDPVEIQVKTGDTSDNVEQDIVPYTRDDNKIDLLHELLIKDGTTKAIIFDETQRSVEKLHMDLTNRGFKTDAIHGAKSQGQRQRALRKFTDNQVNILVATDVAARGIDVADITHVINYTTPQTYDDYVHRIGRTGRAGKTGFAFTFVEAR
ncbi:DEAD/DEAH box helicase [Candidatus Saccharibacteria bacterium]|jgi:superfamily II DNA/RNA helicase|nr:DEAD/DEAH box helicase [Candidatus Saccharibacteria bacterium]MBP7834624.1 DEAD/DEAH box helicase [Candidatus Saccharibacteria bacterium]